MELVMVAGLLALAAFFGNIRVIAICAVLALGAGWYYEGMPKDQQQKVTKIYTDLRLRCERSWKAFWL